MRKLISHRSSVKLTVLTLFVLGACIPGANAAAAGRAARHAGGGRSAPSGVVFGGVTPQGLPGAIQVSRNGRQIVKMALTLLLKCQTGGATIFLPAAYMSVPIGASGTFHETIAHSDSEGEARGTVTGKFNRSMTQVTTRWSLTVVVHNGTVSDTCESGTVNFTAIQ